MKHEAQSSIPFFFRWMRATRPQETRFHVQFIMRLSILNIFGLIKHTVFPVTEVNYFVKKQNVKKILVRDS